MSTATLSSQTTRTSCTVQIESRSATSASADNVTIAVSVQVRTAERELPCRADDPDLWFAETPAQLEQAKVLCADCPIRTRCLNAALDRGEPWGVWGGEIFDQGVVIARKRPRGRPRKAA